MPASVDRAVPEQRILEQSVRLPPEGVVTGWATGRLFGGTFFDGLLPDGRTEMPVPLATGARARIREDDQVTVSRDRIDPGERIVRHGIPCATVLRGGFDAVRMAVDVREAVVAMDMLAAAEITSVRRMRAYVESRPRCNGVPAVREALGLASEDSRSPNETRTRLIWVLDAGLPPPLVNKQVFDLRGRLLGVADLLDIEAGVVGEYDGAEHPRARRHAHDVGREDGFRRHGLEVFRVTGPDVSRRELVVERMHGTRSRAKWLPPGRRAWTLEEPPGRRDAAPTLDEVLDHRDAMAELYASYEQGNR